MGRTLHYFIKKETGKSFTKSDLKAMYNISKKYNSGKLENVWSCESFDCNPIAFHPNWDKEYRSMGAEKAWESINSKIDSIINEKQCCYFDAVFQLLRKREIILINKAYKKEVRGFVKVQGNEFNSLLVLMALVEISKAVPTAEIKISDEGEFLITDLKIKNGRALPLVQSLISDIEQYSHLMLFSKGFSGNILDKLDYKAHDFSHEFMMDSNLENGYGDMTKCINNKLRNLKKVEEVLIGAGLCKQELYFFNLNNRKSKDWFNPLIFTRPLKVEKYLDYQMTPGTLMDGFKGEGFGLSEKDSEAKSYRSIATMMKMLGIDQTNKNDLNILGEN